MLHGIGEQWFDYKGSDGIVLVEDELDQVLLVRFKAQKVIQIIVGE